MLRAFAPEGALHVFDKLERREYRASPRRVGWIAGLNTHPDGVSIEDSATDFDNIGAPRIKMLAEGQLTAGVSPEFSAVLTYLSFMHVRNPKSIEVATTMIARAARAFYEAEHDGKDTILKVTGELESYAREFPDGIQVFPDDDLRILTRSSMRHMHKLMERLDDRFRGMGWGVLRSDGQFVLGDHPVHWLNPRAKREDDYGNGLDRPTIEVTAVVDPSIAPLGSHKRADVPLRFFDRKVTARELRIINARQIEFARRQVFSRYPIKQKKSYVAHCREPLLP